MTSPLLTLFLPSFPQGCSAPLIDFVEQHAIYLIAVAGGLVAIQFIGMLFSICLVCAIKRVEDYDYAKA